MRRFGAGGVAALWLGLAVAPALAGPPEGRGEAEAAKEQPGWWSGLFGGKKAAPQADAAPVKTVADKAAEEAALSRALLRRLAVCDRLREIARDPDRPDPDLEETADQLEQMATKLYAERTGRLLGVAAVGTTPDHLEAAEAPRGAAEDLRGGAPGGPARPRKGKAPSAPAEEDER